MIEPNILVTTTKNICLSSPHPIWPKCRPSAFPSRTSDHIRTKENQNQASATFATIKPVGALDHLCMHSDARSVRTHASHDGLTNLGTNIPRACPAPAAPQFCRPRRDATGARARWTVHLTTHTPDTSFDSISHWTRSSHWSTSTTHTYPSRCMVKSYVPDVFFRRETTYRTCALCYKHKLIGDALAWKEI
jgi:hypothetical protein